MVYIWAFLASIGIMFLEYLYHNVRTTSFFGNWYIWIIPLLGSQFCLYKMFQVGETLWIAGISFTIISAILRCFNTVIYGEPLTWFMLIGIVLMLVGGFIIKL